MWDTGLITNYTVWCIYACQVSLFQVTFWFSVSRHLMELPSGSELWEEREQMDIPHSSHWPRGLEATVSITGQSTWRKDTKRRWEKWLANPCLSSWVLPCWPVIRISKSHVGRWGTRSVRGRCTWEISDPTGCLESGEHMWHWYNHSHMLTITDNEVNYSWRQISITIKRYILFDPVVSLWGIYPFLVGVYKSSLQNCLQEQSWN